MKRKLYALVSLLSVRAEGLEPPCLAALDPKSSASANFATPAKWSAKVYFFGENGKWRVVADVCVCPVLYFAHRSRRYALILSENQAIGIGAK